MFLAALCEDFRVLNAIYILKIVIKAICIIVPIILIVSLMIGLLGYILNGDSKGGFASVTKGMVNKILAAVVVFIVPTILNLVVNIIGFNGASDCYNNANREYIDLKKAEYDSKKEQTYQEALQGLLTAFSKMIEENSNISGGGIASGGASNMVQIAQGQVGNSGGQIYREWYFGKNQSAEWCAIFISWVANQAGVLNTSVPKFALCQDGVKWYQSQGRWQSGDYTPKAGDIIFFDWRSSRDGIADHVGIVESVSNGQVNYISGNDDDSCKRGSYPIGYDSILGYGTV